VLRRSGELPNEGRFLMRGSAMVVAGFLLAGCGTATVVEQSESVPNPPNPYTGPMQVPVDHGDEASVAERSGAAGLALECQGEPYEGGSGDYDSGLTSTQSSAASALEDYFSQDPFLQLPPDGYRVEREDDGRVLLSYDVNDSTKAAFIAADGILDYDDDEGWGIETWAQCDPSEFPGSVTDALGIEVWSDDSGNRVPVTTISSSAGPEHCGWQDITFLTLGGKTRERQYLRDTTDELGDFLATTFDASVSVPTRAIDTGFELDGQRLWLHPDGSAAYVVDEATPEDAERWPAAQEPVWCA
jgi:hypothetical protein